MDLTGLKSRCGQNYVSPEVSPFQNSWHSNIYKVTFAILGNIWTGCGGIWWRQRWLGEHYSAHPKQCEHKSRYDDIIPVLKESKQWNEWAAILYIYIFCNYCCVIIIKNASISLGIREGFGMKWYLRHMIKTLFEVYVTF